MKFTCPLYKAKIDGDPVKQNHCVWVPMDRRSVHVMCPERKSGKA